MSYQLTLPVCVTSVHQVTPEIKHFIIEALDGLPLPTFSGGSHVVVIMRDGAHVHKNPYSLMGDGHDSRQYEIAVRRENPSRGGSAFMFEKIKQGDTLELLQPANFFMLDTFARKHLLIAGGIGITALRSMIHDLKRAKADYALHYCVRSGQNAAFWEAISQQSGARAHLHAGENRLDIPALLRLQPSGTHVYVCGPHSMVKAVNDACAALGWSASHIHHEEFTHASGGAPFDVTLARSGRHIHVEHNQSMLEALEAAGLEPRYMCRGGVCGACETAVIEGQIEHRDHFMTTQEKAGMQKMMICVSRATAAGIVIDL